MTDLITTGEAMEVLEVADTANPLVRDRLDRIRRGVEAAARRYVKWEIHRQTVTEYYDGTGSRDIALKGLFPSSVTGVWLDLTGFYGQNASGFGSGTELTQGQDFALVQPNQMNALLRMVSASNQILFPSDYFFRRRAGGLSYCYPAFWPSGYGNVKITYTFGFESLPDDLRLAIIEACGYVWNMAKYGFPVTSEGLADYNYSLFISRDRQFADVRMILNQYRDTAIGLSLP